MKDFKLDKETKLSSGFKVPDHYFDDLQSKIMQRLPEQEPQIISIFTTRKKWFFAAAAVLILTLSLPLINHMNAPFSSNVDDAALENYLINHAELSDDDLVEVLDIEDLQNMKINMRIEDQDLEDILTSNNNLEEDIIN